MTAIVPLAATTAPAAASASHGGVGDRVVTASFTAASGKKLGKSLLFVSTAAGVNLE
jgi:hypothetical protein